MIKFKIIKFLFKLHNNYTHYYNSYNNKIYFQYSINTNYNNKLNKNKVRQRKEKNKLINKYYKKKI